MKNKSPFLVSTNWLAARLNDPNVAIVDASWYLPAMKRDGGDEYKSHHIPGAVFFDIDSIVEPDSELPHTLANPEIFASEVGKLGISNDQTIVIYDGAGLFSAPRVWLNFRIMGASEVFILDGGFPQWLEDGMPVESGSASTTPNLFVPNFDAGAIVELDEMQAVVADQSAHVADARPQGRFAGNEPEPRAGLRSGHMPNAINIPVTALSSNGKLLPLDQLEIVFSDTGIAMNDPVVTTCGSGVTAAIISLALESTDRHNHRLFDGSWAEWGGRTDTDVVTTDV